MQAYRVGRVLSDTAEYAKSRHSKLEASVADTRRQQLELAQKITATYQQIAPLVLHDSPDVKEIQSVQTLLNTLRHEIAKSTQDLQQCENTLASQQTQLHKLREQIEPLEHERDQRLLANEQAQSALQAWRFAQTESQQQQKYHNDLIDETSAKLEEYHQQREFMFLLKRGYAQPDYRGWLIARNLDSWLARRVNYTSNYNNYQMLHALREQSANNLQNVQQREQQRSDIYQHIIDETENALNLSALHAQVKANEELLSNGQQQRQSLQKELQQYARGEGTTFTDISTRLSEQLAALPLEKLDVLVAKTATPDDDRLLQELRDLKETECQLQDTLLQQQRNSQAAGIRAAAATRLENEFIRGGYSNANYVYDWGFTEHPEELFEAFINGEIALDDVFEKLNSIARFVSNAPSSSASNILSISLAVLDAVATSSARTRPSSSSSSSQSSSSSSSSSSTGGGSSSTSSSTGGGGFRSTDSF